MSASVSTLRTGVRRGTTEFAATLRSPGELSFYFVGAVVFAAFIVVKGDDELANTGITIASYVFPGVMAFSIVFMAAFGLAAQLTAEREDGTMLRLKAVPQGTLGYVVGHVTRTLAEAVFTLVLLSIPAVVLLDQPRTSGVPDVLRAVAIVFLGLLACMPIGFALGSIFKSSRSVGGWGFLIVGALVGGSGLLVPTSSLPGWMTTISQLLPPYWLGLGMRASLLPESVSAIETDASWRTAETVAVLGSWAVVGLIVAPILVRRTARQQSGSAVAARQHKALQRV